MINDISRLTNRRADVLLFGIPAFVFLFGDFCLSALARLRVPKHFAELAPSPEVLETLMTREAASRIMLLAAFLLLITVSLGVIVWFVADVASSLFSAAGKLFLIVGAGLSIACVTALLPWQLVGHSRAIEILGDDTYLQALKIAGSEAIGVKPNWTIDTLWWAILIARWVSGVAISCTLMSSISCAAAGSLPQENEQADQKNRAKARWLYEFDALTLQVSRLNNCLYVGAVLLVTAVAFVATFSSWPAFVFSADPGLQTYGTDFSKLANSYVLFIGLQFSLYLGAIFLPIWMLHANRLDHLRNSASSSGVLRELKSIPTVPNLTFSKLLSKQTLAILAPLMTGILSGLPQAIESFIASP